MRYAIVSGRADDLATTVARYLPDNYEVLCALEPSAVGDLPRVLIGGTDSAGWTFEDYVQPRLASGLFHAAEISEDLARSLDDLSWMDRMADEFGGGSL